MGGFFPHTGAITQGYTTLPCTTYGTVLDDIVMDLGTGQNGWTLHDDQRNVVGSIWWPWAGGFNYNAPSYASYARNFVTTNGSAAVDWSGYFNGAAAYRSGGRATWDLTPGLTQVSVDNVNWYGVLSVQNFYQFTLDRNFTGATVANGWQNLFVKTMGYIVLKCTSAQKTFYLQITRPMTTGARFLIFQVFETWNSVTHTGTCGGPQEAVRAYSTYNKPLTSRVQYMLFLLPDAFAFWCGGDPMEPGGGQVWDLYYCGNMTPLRTNDTNCLVQACTNQDWSGIFPMNTGDLFTTAYNTWGGASVLRTLGGTTWWHPASQQGASWGNMYALVPRGADYVWALDRTSFDESARMQFVEYDAYQCGSNNNGNAISEGKRGELKWLKSPVMNPTGLQTASLGPSDDGNTYICLHTSLPWIANQYSGASWPGDVITNTGPLCSGFVHTNRYGNTGAFSTNVAVAYIVRRCFLLPINL